MTTQTISKFNTPKEPCSVEGCTALNKGFSFCSKHYQRFKKHGNPHIITKRESTFENLVARFWKYVEKDANDAGCWTWIGRRSSKGYGTIKYKGKLWQAHRLVFMVLGLPVPTECSLHKCDNRPCVNPAHLFEGTRGDNNRDREAKGRGYKGPRPWLRNQGVKHGGL